MVVGHSFSPPHCPIPTSGWICGSVAKIYIERAEICLVVYGTSEVWKYQDFAFARAWLNCICVCSVRGGRAVQALDGAEED